MCIRDRFVCGWQVKLCDPFVTHESYLSALWSCIMIKVLYKYQLHYFSQKQLFSESQCSYSYQTYVFVVTHDGRVGAITQSNVQH